LRIIHDDVLAGLAQLEDGAARCVVTSPPYWGLRDYGIPPSTWPDGWVGCLGLEPTPQLYVDHVVAVFREVRRVLAKDGTLWLNMGDCYVSAPPGNADRDHSGGVWRDTRGQQEAAAVRKQARGYRGDRLANGRGDSPAVLRRKTRATRDGSHAGKHTAMAALGPMEQPNRAPIPGLKPKDLVGMPWRVAFALQADGWWLRSEIIWAKPNPMPESAKDRPTRSHEQLFMLSRSARYFYDYAGAAEPTTGGAHSRGRAGAPFDNTPSGWDVGASRSHRQKIGRYRSGNKARKFRANHGGVSEDLQRGHQGMSVPWDDNGHRNRRTVWTIPTQPFAEAHFATFPEALAEPCIRAGSAPGDLVLDPFGGAGTTGVVALRLGRRCTLIELSSSSVDIARRRINGPLFAKELA
jgi:site-specific DNA-methyltransferase (cytosine-N4-specific)